MKVRLILSSIFIFNLASLPAQASCTVGSENSNDYIRRANNRCEGRQRSRSNISGAITLRSLTSSTGGSLGSTLAMKIPKIASNQPNITVTAFNVNGYRLDNLSLHSSGKFYRFNLPTKIINNLGITLDNLRGRAEKGGNQRVYLPLIFNTASSKYRFVFYSSRQASFQKAEIRKDGRALTSWGTQARKQGEKQFEWTPGSAPAGQYTFYFEANIYQRSGSPEHIRKSIAFEHNPTWLR